MAATLSVKISTDSGNRVGLGGDNGIYASPSAVLNPSNTAFMTIDNQFAASGAQWFYQLGCSGLPTASPSLNTAQVWPLIVTKACRVTDAAIFLITGTTASSLYATLYTSSGANKAPGAKITDLLRFPTTTAGASRQASVDSTTLLSAHTLYWVATWINGSSSPTFLARAQYGGVLRLPTVPGATVFTGGSGLAYVDSSQSWSSLTSGPTTLAPTALPTNSTQSSGNLTVPAIAWGLTNA